MSVRLYGGPPDQATPEIRSRILRQRHRCELALPRCSVTPTHVIRTADEDRTRLVAACAYCAERSAEQ